MDTNKVKTAITNAHTELNTLIDAEYADAKKTGRNFKRLEVLGQAAKSLIAAERNVEKALQAAAPKATKADGKAAAKKN